MQYDGPADMSVYAWSVTAGDCTIDGPADGASVMVDFGVADCTLHLEIEDANGCTDSCDKTVTVYDDPTCVFDPIDTTYAGVMTGTITEGTPPYSCVDATVDGDGWAIAGGVGGCQVLSEKRCSAEDDRDGDGFPDACVDDADCKVCSGSGNPCLTVADCEATETCDANPAEQCVYGFEIAYTVTQPATTTPTFAATFSDANDCETDCSSSITVRVGCSLDEPLKEVCDGFTEEFCVTGEGGALPYSYSWTGPGGFEADTQCITVGVAGIYSVIVRDGNGFPSPPCEALLIVNANPFCEIQPPVDNPICGSTRNPLTVVASGGTPPYVDYAWLVSSPDSDWIITSGDGTDTIEYQAGQTGPALFTVTVTDSKGCQHTCELNVRCVPLTGEEYCSLTQGAYGNYGGKYGGMGTLELIEHLLAFDDLLIGVLGVRSVTIPLSAAACIIERLPSGGRPEALPLLDPADQVLSDPDDPTSPCQTETPLPIHNGKFRNVFLGQVIALSLNVRLDFDPDPGNLTLGDLELCEIMVTHGALCGDDGICGTSDDELDPGPDGIFGFNPDTGMNDDPVMTIWIPAEVIAALESDPTLGNSVDGLLALANSALAGEDIGDVRLSAIADAVGAINDGFDECRFLISCENEEFKSARGATDGGRR